MKLVIQRVSHAELWVEGEHFSSVQKGLVAFVGVAKRDTRKDAEYLAAKVIELRIFPDEMGKMNRNISEYGGEILIVSNFTLYGDTAKGRRPSFDQAAKPERAREIYDYFVEKMRESGLPVATGVFQAHMRVLVENDGPVTLICDSPASNTLGID